MRYFETVKHALDASLGGICRLRGVTPDQALQMTKQHLQIMRDEWFSGAQPNIAYQDPVCRFAYLYCHTAVNANLCEYAIRSSPDVTALINSKLTQDGELRVCAFGGGPGTELLALAKHLCKTRAAGPHGVVDFTLLDYVPEWAESWNAIEKAIKARLSAKFGPFIKWPFSTSKTFSPFDMTKVDQYANLDQLFTHDLYLMNYVVSEIFDGSALQALLSRMALAAPSGSKFLIIDRNQDHVASAAQLLLSTAGLSTSDVSTTSSNMDSDEQSTALNPYPDRIGRAPRVQWKGAFWVVGTKP
jgi:hypothetical protein